MPHSVLSFIYQLTESMKGSINSIHLKSFVTPSLYNFEISRDFLPPVSPGDKRRKFQNPEKIMVLKVFLIFLSL